MCIYFVRHISSTYVNKTRFAFHSANFPRVAKSKMSVIFDILSFKSVFQAIFHMQLMFLFEIVLVPIAQFIVVP